MQGEARKPAWTHLLGAAALVLLLVGLYLLLMRLSVGATHVDRDTSESDRDTIYFALHLSLLVAAGAAGFAFGRWLGGYGIAYAALLVVVLAIGMLALQLASFELACRGYNDLIRHWQCE